MKIGIVCAINRELEPFLPHIQNCKISQKAMLIFYEGTINGVYVVALFSGASKTNAAIATQVLIDTHNVDAVIHAGTAGGMKKELNILDTVISTEVTHHDVYEVILTESHPKMPSIYFQADETLINLSKKMTERLNPQHKIHFGRMVSGEKFIDEEGRAQINSKYEPLTVDMETAGVAHACYVNNIPFLAVRTVTDTAANSGTENFDKNCAAAALITKDVMLELLKEIESGIC